MRPQPPGELPEPQQRRRPANQLLVPRWEWIDLVVAGQEVIQQRHWCALVLPQVEVPDVEQRLGPSDLTEVDQAGVLTVDLEDVRGVEVAVRQCGAPEVPAALAVDQRPQPLQLRDGEQRPERPWPRVGKVGGDELGVGPRCGAKWPGGGWRRTQPKPWTPTPLSTASSRPAARATRRAACWSRQRARDSPAISPMTSTERPRASSNGSAWTTRGTRKPRSRRCSRSAASTERSSWSSSAIRTYSTRRAAWTRYTWVATPAGVRAAVSSGPRMRRSIARSVRWSTSDLRSNPPPLERAFSHRLMLMSCGRRGGTPIIVGEPSTQRTCASCFASST
jgi:hypothetical protein